MRWMPVCLILTLDWFKKMLTSIAPPVLPYWPAGSDPRWRFLLLLSGYVLLGVTFLGFNRSPLQILLTVGVTVAFDQLCHKLLRPEQPPLFPLSAAISGLGLTILVNFAHGLWLPLVAVFFTVAGKYLITHNNRHVFNPTLLGITLSLLVGQGMISAAPAYQWGGNLAAAAFIVTAAFLVFVFRINRLWLMLGFLGFYSVQLALRAWLTRHHLPPETLFLGALTSPAFYLFVFFMLPDPATSPPTRRGQLLMALVIVLLDLLLHLKQGFSTLFFAGSAWFLGRLLWLHGCSVWQERGQYFRRLRPWLRRLALFAVIGSGLALGFHLRFTPERFNPGFVFQEIPVAQSGLVGEPGDLLQRVDPRLAHLAKWVLSVGDAAAVADFNNDGLLDLFLTYPLKRPQDRAALYANRGGFRFERVALPALDTLIADPAQQGLPSGALWLDIDNDTDPDLLVLVGFGTLRLLQNQLAETGTPNFVDATAAWGLAGQHSVALAANALDWNRDGRLDLIIGNAFAPWLPDYDPPVPLNVFSLPPAQSPTDRRPFNFMHRTWYDANNGGGVRLWQNHGSTLVAQQAQTQGIAGQRWTLSIGTADFNGDGWSDLYLANDFGPDQLLLNQPSNPGSWQAVTGSLVGTVGRDTYKGMNATTADFDNNGWPDVYVSNVHHKLQAEGSLLWLNQGLTADRPERFEDAAMARGMLNERRFGWGAAAGDLDRDGRIDLVQANGMVDNAYEPAALQTACPDYWYWNDKIALTGPEVHGYADRWADLRGRCIFPSEQNRIYLNRGAYFVDVAAQAGWQQKGVSRGIALADFDNNGTLDAVVTHQFAPVSLFRNDSLPRHWLGVELVGNGQNCNRDALGSKVVLTTPSGQQMRQQVAANGFSAQGDPRLLFGLGQNPPPAGLTVQVDWCGQGQNQAFNLSPNRYHRLQQALRP